MFLLTTHEQRFIISVCPTAALRRALPSEQLSGEHNKMEKVYRNEKEFF